MRFDKFGFIAIIIGLVIMLGMLHFFFMERYCPAGTWCIGGLISAITLTIKGAVILFGVVLFIIGLLLMLL
ncbi:MAG: hypothetical protein V1911_02015 [Candidatus Micrarchaeota archaeon]